MTINEYLKANESFHGKFSYKNTVPHIVCKDGFKISVQASKSHYCEPREDVGPYTQVECGYPSDRVSDALNQFADDPSTNDTIYAYVPIDIVEAELALHGGIAK